MASNPTQFDVMILPNLYGAILANIGCGVIGGPGLVSGVNIGTDIAVFETVCTINLVGRMPVLCTVYLLVASTIIVAVKYSIFSIQNTVSSLFIP